MITSYTDLLLGFTAGSFVMACGYVLGRIKAFGTWGIED